MNRFLQVFCSVFSGFLIFLALPNEFSSTGNIYIAFLSLIPLYITIQSAKSSRQTALFCAISGFTSHILSSLWLKNFRAFALFTLGASALGTAGIEAFAGFFMYLPFAAPECASKNQGLFHLPPFYRTKAARIFYFSAVYTLYEWYKSNGFIGYPWGTISMAFANTRFLSQSADIFGTYGLTFLAALFSAVLGEAVIAIKNRRITCSFKFSKDRTLSGAALTAFSYTALLALYGAYQFYKPRTPVKILNAALIQQNQDPWMHAADTESIEISMDLTEKALTDFASRGLKCDLIVWSEGILRYSFPNAFVRYTIMPEDRPLVPFIIRSQAPLIAGGSYALNSEKNQYCNAALLFDKDGNFRGWYGKRHLVPFAEVIPYSELAPVKKILVALTGFSFGWTPGPQITLFDIPARYSEEPLINGYNIIDISKPAEDEVSFFGAAPNAQANVRVSVPICFEDAFADSVRPFHKSGSEIFLDITDDSWSKTKSAEWQHLAVSLFRAIEFRTTLVRCTNSGATVVAEPNGKIVESLPLFERTYLASSIPVYMPQTTLYSEYGDWFCLLLFGCALLYIVLSMRKSNCKPVYRNTRKL